MEFTRLFVMAVKQYLALVVMHVAFAELLCRATSSPPVPLQRTLCIPYVGSISYLNASQFDRELILRPPPDERVVLEAETNASIIYTISMPSACSLEFSAIQMQLTGACNIEVNISQPGLEHHGNLTRFAFCGGQGFENITEQFVGFVGNPMPGTANTSGAADNATSITVTIAQSHQCSQDKCLLHGVDAGGRGVAILARDINECTSGLVSCDKPLNCQNTLGGYTCQCPHQHSLHTALMPTDSGSGILETTACVPNSCLEICGNDNITVCMAAEIGDSDCLCSWSISENILNCSVLLNTTESNPMAGETSTSPAYNTSACNASVHSCDSDSDLQALFVIPAITGALLILLVAYIVKQCHEGRLSWALVSWRLRYATSVLPTTSKQQRKRYLVTREPSRSESRQSAADQHNSSRLSVNSHSSMQQGSGQDCIRAGSSALHLVPPMYGKHSKRPQRPMRRPSPASWRSNALDLAEVPQKPGSKAAKTSSNAANSRLRRGSAPNPTGEFYCELPSLMADSNAVSSPDKRSCRVSTTCSLASPASHSITSKSDRQRVEDTIDGADAGLISGQQTASRHYISTTGDKLPAMPSGSNSSPKCNSRPDSDLDLSPTVSTASHITCHSSPGNSPESPTGMDRELDPMRSRLSEIGLFPELHGRVRSMRERFDSIPQENISGNFGPTMIANSYTSKGNAAQRSTASSPARRGIHGQSPLTSQKLTALPARQ